MSKPSLRLTVLAGLLGLAAGCASAQTQQQVAPLVSGMYGALEALYKDLHAHPELAFQEVRTAARLAEEMRKLGFEVTEKVGGTGVVALLRNGAGPTVLVRTELDALPMEENRPALREHGEGPVRGPRDLRRAQLRA